METNLTTYLPDWFRQILDFHELMSTESTAFEALAEAISLVRNNFFIQTSNESTISQWESIFDIIPNPNVESLEFRRQRILNRLSMQPPFTLPFLKERLNQLIGEGKWSIEIDYGNYTIYIAASAENQAWATELSWTLNTIKPCHIVYTVRPLVNNIVTVNEQVSLSENIYHYRLGSWGIGVNPFLSNVNKGVIVTPDQKTIQTPFLDDIAGYTIEDITSAQINGSISITDLQKSSSGNMATVVYSVSQAQTDTVTQVSLLGSGGEILTSAPVYVPVTSETVQLTHTITIEEG